MVEQGGVCSLRLPDPAWMQFVCLAVSLEHSEVMGVIDGYEHPMLNPSWKTSITEYMKVPLWLVCQTMKIS